MPPKKYHFTLNEMAQSQLKTRANLYGCTMGELIENMLSTFELTLQTVLEVGKVNENKTPYIKEFMHLALQSGVYEGDMSDSFKKAIKGKVIQLEQLNRQNFKKRGMWKPTIKAPEPPAAEFSWDEKLGAEISEEILLSEINRAYKITGIQERNKSLDRAFEDLIRLATMDNLLNTPGFEKEIKNTGDEWKKEQKK
ncbi:MAG: hypothetical protein KAR45_02835 [Desulfobacteraceae bacterium]|nr:hypothetical protein [Desulfobacteraceae bacterium]